MPADTGAKMIQNEQHIVTVGLHSASIQFDAGNYRLVFGRVEGGDFIATRSAGNYRTFKGAEKAARKHLDRLAA